MAFLTPEQQKAVRIKGSTKHTLERLEKSVLIVHMSADAALEMREFQKKKEGAEGMDRKTQRELFLHMLTNAIATEEGDLFGKPDAELLLKTLNMGEVTALIDRVNKMLGESLGELGKTKGSSAEGAETSNSVSA